MGVGVPESSRTAAHHSARWRGNVGAALLACVSLSYAEEPAPAVDMFRHLQDALASNRSAVSVAMPAFQLSDPELLPEDIDYDPG